MEDYQAHNVGAKSAVDVQQATDDHILKRLNKKVNGLDRLLGQTPTIQNQGDLVKPDGTIAKDNDDIRLVEQRPLRTPRGVIEYKEATPDENFPIKIPLQSVKYDIESFMEAVDTSFNSYLKGFEQMELPEEVAINVLDNPSKPEIEVETHFVDSRDNEDPDQDKADPPTATEEFGDKWELKTEFNSAGDLTGVAGTIFVLWKGIRYRFNNGLPQGDSNQIGGSPVHHFEGSVNPPPVKGLTNTLEGRNLEVFMKDRDMTYGDIDIVPKAEITEAPVINRFIINGELDDVEWGPVEKDGCQYNNEEIELNLGDGRIRYEKGDLIRPAGYDDDNVDEYDKVFLPDLSTRWTEYHPDETEKPAKRSQVYTPTGNEFTTKQWEGELIRGYTGGMKAGYFMVCRGEVKKYTGGLDYYATVKKLPGSTNPSNAENNYDEYHNRTYTAMDWNQIKHLGYPANAKVTKTRYSPDARVRIGQHKDLAGWTAELEVGKKYHANAYKRHRHGSNTWHNHYASVPGHEKISQWTENSLTSIFIPKGMKVRLRTGIDDSPFFSPGRERWITGDDYTINFTGNDNDAFDTIEVHEHNGGTRGLSAGGGKLDRDDYKEYIAEDSFYRKAHLAPYNKLFEG